MPTVYGAEQVAPEDNLLRVVYDKGPVAVRAGARRSWPHTLSLLGRRLAGSVLKRWQ